MPPAAGAANVVDGPRAQRIEGRKEGDRSDVHVPRGPVPPMAFAGQPVGQYAFDIANGMRNLQVSHPDKIGVPNTQNRSNMAAKVRDCPNCYSVRDCTYSFTQTRMEHFL